MTTAHQLFPRQVTPSPAKAARRRSRDLPEPAERRRLREQWGLSTRQVALAFGVTPATVRSWEGGRTAPRGGRKEAYRQFLSGLAQHGAVLGTAAARPEQRPAPEHPPRPERRPRPAPAARRPGPTRVRPVVCGQAPRVPAGVPEAGVRAGGRDPVSPERIRRLRLLGAAACVWSLAWWVILTCPPPL
ncbi:helix-turn-helix domain-containing protein [Streptomyces sp. NPDC048507]|uniref:helix-turn-helix domain-containing protein n=1 Tax=Streptomyces sp. NPDC048507 TaxID=3365560 RepID=UPI003722E238